MTREEAIHKMEYSKRAYQMLIDEKVQEGVLVGQGINGEWSADTPIIDAYKDMLEACDMAIKALEQEPCGDAILREDAIRTLRADDLFVCTGDKMQAISDIEGLSPVNPQEPKMGHWSHDGSHWKNRFICSECNYKLFDEPTNFCPNCGAKMSEIPTD